MSNPPVDWIFLDIRTQCRANLALAKRDRHKEAGMVSKTNEQALEASIEKYLIGTCRSRRRYATELPAGPHHGYQRGRT